MSFSPVRIDLQTRCVGARLADPRLPLPPLSEANHRHDPPRSTLESSAPLAEVLDRLAQQLSERRDLNQRLQHELQEASIEIAYAVVSRLWGEHGATLPIRPMIQGLIAGMRPTRNATLRLHPRDFLAWEKESQQSLPPEIAQLPVSPDPELAPGAYRLDTDEWKLETSVRSLLAELRQQLLEETADAQYEPRSAANLYPPLPGPAHHRTPA